MYGDLISFIVILCVLILIFILIRSIILWYFKLDKIASLLEAILYELKNKN